MLDLINYNRDYGLPLNWFLFEDDYGYSLPMNKELKTIEQAQNYFNKLAETLGSDYKLNYYFVEPDDDLSDIKNIYGEQLYKGFFEKFKEMCDNELCDI